MAVDAFEGLATFIMKHLDHVELHPASFSPALLVDMASFQNWYILPLFASMNKFDQFMITRRFQRRLQNVFKARICIPDHHPSWDRPTQLKIKQLGKKRAKLWAYRFWDERNKQALGRRLVCPA
jgi:hypothetical protein